MKSVLRKAIDKYNWGILSPEETEQFISDLIEEVEDLSEKIDNSVSTERYDSLSDELYILEEEKNALEDKIEELEEKLKQYENERD